VAGAAQTTPGIPFQWNSLTVSQQSALLLDGGSGASDGTFTLPLTSGSSLCTSDNVPAGCTAKGKVRLNWLRGDQSTEGATATRFRVRPTTVLGDIVNSTPRYTGPPAGNSTDATFTQFKSDFSSRTPMLYVGGNDGMLHAFEATTGTSGGVERLAYVPNKMYPLLTKLTAKNYSHRYFVDGCLYRRAGHRRRLRGVDQLENRPRRGLQRRRQGLLRPQRDRPGQLHRGAGQHDRHVGIHQRQRCGSRLHL
jgi:Tfp pilus tip-associated adhesin PilY1